MLKFQLSVFKTSNKKFELSYLKVAPRFNITLFTMIRLSTNFPSVRTHFTH